MTKDVRVYTFSEPLAGEAEARFDICPGDGNLSIDGLAGSQVLIAGELEYADSQGPPTLKMEPGSRPSTLRLHGAPRKQAWVRMPWAACNGATDWLVHLNPAAAADIQARSDGGNLRLDLSGMKVARVTAETGGGSIALRLPEEARGLFVSALSGAGNVEVEIGRAFRGRSMLNLSSGAGNVSVLVPDGLPACIHISTGMGKALVDPAFAKVNGVTYQSAGYESAHDRIEISLKSGMGNVVVQKK